MRIAFYAPLKSPEHPVPSGDRQMARLLIAALRRAGHSVELVSELRSFMKVPDPDDWNRVQSLAESEVARLTQKWNGVDTPDLWFSYHPYYKAPDLIGPILAASLNIPYVTAEASYSRRRDKSGWADMQQWVGAAVRQAKLNICMTDRDQQGLVGAIPEGHYARLKPFIDTAAFHRPASHNNSSHLVTVAMMRSGDKFDSFRMLATALGKIANLHWTLTIMGDGPERQAVEALFSDFDPNRIVWTGERSSPEVVEMLGEGGTYVWPGCGEAYGLAYLEAQASGLPVIAQNIAGVPEVVLDGTTGILTPAGDTNAYAEAIQQMLENAGARDAMGKAAREFVLSERSLDRAACTLNNLLQFDRTKQS